MDTSATAGVADKGAVGRLSTPPAAAAAGVAFAVLYGVCVVLLRLSFPQEMTAAAAWPPDSAESLTIATILMPFAGIAFLWFIGVVRARLGEAEDKFFASVFHGAGLLFVAMSFAAFAIAAGLLVAFQAGGPEIVTSSTYLIGHSIVTQFFNLYGLKMAGVFLFSLATLWRRTGTMPRALAMLTYVVALAMLVSLSRNLWFALLFPAWILLLSLYMLISGRRAGRETD